MADAWDQFPEAGGTAVAAEPDPWAAFPDEKKQPDAFASFPDVGSEQPTVSDLMSGKFGTTVHIPEGVHVPVVSETGAIPAGLIEGALRYTNPLGLAQVAAEKIAPDALPTKIGAGVIGGASEALASFTTPENLASLAVMPEAKVAQILLNLGFAGEAVVNLPAQIKAFGATNDPQEKAKIATGIATSLGLPALGLTHAAIRKAPLKSFDQLPSDFVPADPVAAGVSPAIPDPAAGTAATTGGVPSVPFLADPAVPFMTKVRIKDQMLERGLTSDQIDTATTAEVQELIQRSQSRPVDSTSETQPAAEVQELIQRSQSWPVDSTSETQPAGRWFLADNENRPRVDPPESDQSKPSPGATSVRSLTPQDLPARTDQLASPPEFLAPESRSSSRPEPTPPENLRQDLQDSPDLGSRKNRANPVQSSEEIAAENEYRASLLEDARTSQTQSGPELLDAIADSGGLPARNAAAREAFAGEIKRLDETARDPQRAERIPLNKLFRQDAPGIDELATRLRDRGFDVQTPGELLGLVEDRLRTGKQVYGMPELSRQAAPEVPSYEDVFGFGPGAAAQAEKLRPDIPTAAQLADYVESVKTGDPERFARSVGRISETIHQARDGVSRAVATVANVARGFKRAVWDPPKPTNFDRWTGKWDATLQYNDFHIKRLGKELERAVPDPKRQEAIYNWAAADGEEALLREWAGMAPKDVRAGYEDALTLTNEEQRLANLQRSAYDEWLHRAIENGMLREGTENYMKRIVVKRPEIEADLHAKMATGRFSTNFKESKRRFWGAMVEAERAGIRYDKRIRGQSLYAQSFEHAAINRTAVRQFFEGETESGRPFAIVEGTGIPIEGSDQASPSLMVTPFGARTVRGASELAETLLQKHPEWSPQKALSTAREKILAEYEPLNHPAFKNWQWVHKFEDGTNVFVRGDALVHSTIAPKLRNAFEKQRIDWLEPVLKAQGFVKGSKLSLSLFHNVHEVANAVGHLTNPVNLRPLREYLDMPAIKQALEAGLKLVGSSHEQAYLAEGAGSHGWPELVPFLGDYVKAFKDASFEDWIPRLKAEGYLLAFARNQKGGITGLRPTKKLSDEQLAVLTSRQMNATFGEQNHRQMMRDPRLQQALQGLFLAPDFGESKVRHIAQAFTRYGGEQRMALGFVAAGLYLGARVINTAASGDPRWDKPFSVIIGDREYTVRSLPGDLVHLLSDSRSFVYHRVAPLVQNGLEALLKRDFRGRVVDWSDVAKDMLLSLVPIPLTHKEGLSWKDQLASAMGVTPMPYRYENEIRKRIVDFKKNSGDPKMIHELERAEQQTFAASDYKPLRDALRDNNLDAAYAEYKKLLQLKGGNVKAMFAISDALREWKAAPLTGSTRTEIKFKQSLSPPDRELYRQARADRGRIYDRFMEMKRAGSVFAPPPSPSR